MKTLNLFFLFCSLTSEIIASNNRLTNTENIYFNDNKKFIKGGQFKDFILPVPIIGKLQRDGLWGGDNVLPRDKSNGIEDNTWCYWGGNPMLGDDGKYHIEICRWLESTGHNGWFNSEVAHSVSDSGNPLGPYRVTKTILKKGHNPEVIRLKDGTYALHIMTDDVYTSPTLDGDWKHIGRMKMDPQRFKPSSNMGSNLTTSLRPDGSILLLTKGGDVAISKSNILGTYELVSLCNYKRNSGYAEDPVVWRSLHQYHCIYNHAQDRVSGYMRSLDGIHWKNEDGLPYDVSSIYYTNGVKNEWYKFERPKVVQDKLGRASYLSLAVLDVAKSEERPNDNHSAKNTILPLVVEKLISITDKIEITSKTKIIHVLIKAENGFTPSKDVDVKSLLFGSDSYVDYGKGCKAVSSKAMKNGDLLLTFKGENGINYQDYDFKMIGKEKSGKLLVGYALLPGKSNMCASLISLPAMVKDGRVISTIENMGLSDSKPTSATIYHYGKSGREKMAEINVPSLKPYENFDFSLKLRAENQDKDEYEIMIKNYGSGADTWNMVDDTDKSVEFTGDWTTENDDRYFLNSQRTSTQKGSAAKFTFNGTRARVYGTLDNSYGSFDVFVDGMFVENIRLSWGGIKAKVYQTRVLKYGKHTIELKVNDYQKNCKGSIDAFSYEACE